MKNAKKTIALLTIATMLLAGLLAGCATSAPSAAPTTAASAAAASTDLPQATENPDKTKVDFWYLWSSASETKFIESMVSEFNSSQDKYQVVGLSSPDVQKMIVAISGGSGPDITDNFDTNIASYADQGILEPLDDYIKSSNYDISDYLPAAIQDCQYNGKTYALPMTASTFMMFYNKKLFAEAGIAAPPKTDVELLDDAIKLTKINADKTIDVMGYPCYPFVYFTNNMTYAYGGSLMDSSGKFTPDNPGTRLALNNVVQYVQKFGAGNVSAFSSSAKYCDPADPFIQGKQAIRIDGPWFGNTIKNVIKADIDYGVAPLPYPDGHPEFANSAILGSSVFFIPTTAKQKDGAWAFMSWLMAGPQMLNFCANMANLPARTSIMGDAKITAGVDANEFINVLKNPNMKVLPSTPKLAEFGTDFGAEVDKIVNLSESVDDGLKAITDQAASIK
jgi:multiple sugar transport system substrate-binding protein